MSALVRPVFCLIAIALAGCATVGSNTTSRMSSRDHAVQLQIFLDAQNFGPGVIDGRPGEFTEKALAFYRQSKGLPTNSQPDVSLIQPYTTYTITTKDLSVLGTMGEDPAALSKQKSLPYVTLTELLSERFHTTEDFLQDLNPGVDPNTLAAGAVIKVPNARRPLRLDSYPASYTRTSASGRSVVVDITTRMLEVREGGAVIAAFPITPGSAEHPAPVGEWRVLGAVPWPWYRFDEGVLERGERTKIFFMLPPGPNSPVGILWTGLNRPGIGIHGTTSPETIGRAGSHGCIRLANWDAATFYTLIGKGTPVTIR